MILRSTSNLFPLMRWCRENRVAPTGAKGRMMQDLFERFCDEYNLDYDFKRNGGTQYFQKDTQKAFIIFKYGHNFIADKSWYGPT